MQAIHPTHRRALAVLKRGGSYEQIAEALGSSVRSAIDFARDPLAFAGYKGPRYSEVEGPGA